MIHALVVVEKNISSVMGNNYASIIFQLYGKFKIGGLMLIFVLAGMVQGKAQIIISEEPEITNLMEQFKRQNQLNKVVRGWKIQILTTNDRREMEKGIAEFEILYPDIPYTWEHNPPYYQVRIGAYELREDLEPMLLQLKQDFPAALPVQSEMEKKDLIEIPK